MKIVSTKQMHIGHFLWKKFYQFLFTAFTIGLIVIISVCLKTSKNDFYGTFIEQIKLFANSLANLIELTVQIGASSGLPLLNLIKEPLTYSFLILFTAFLCTFLFGISISYVVYQFPRKVKKVVKECLFFLQSIPDVMVIFGFQLLIIWFYKKTDILLIDPIAGVEKVYALPILFVSLLPGIMLFQMTFLAIEEESNKTYVEFARAKGLSHGWVLLQHILRNVVVTLFSNAHYMFWLLISNQLVVEYLFNIHGYFTFLYEILNKPDLFFICLLFLFIPFYLIEVLINFITLKVHGKEQFE